MRDRFLWVGCFVYAALLTWLGAVKYDVHRNLVDFGIFAQTVTSAFGCFCNPIEGNHWALHFSPILYPVGIATAFARTPLTLIALQAIAGALVAPPIYALVRMTQGTGISRLAAMTVWCYPPLAGLIFGDFHENGFAPATVAWMLYAFQAGSMTGAVAFALATLAVKEDQAIFLTIAGAVGAWSCRGTVRGRVAAAIALFSALLFVAYFALIQPHASAGGGSSWAPWRFYAWGGGSVHELLATLPNRLGFLLLAFVPLLFLPLTSPAIVLAIAPLAEVLLSSMPTTYTMGTHYAGAWAGYVLVAFALALQRIAPLRARALLVACIVLCGAEFAIADPLHPGLNLRAVQVRDVALDRFLRALPPDVSVATQEEAYTHLAINDPYARLLPELPSRRTRACFVLLDYDFPDSARLQEYGDAFARMIREGRYVPIVRAGGITLYRRADRCN